MKKIFSVGVLVLMLTLAYSSTARADGVGDPLHGVCLSPTPVCSDNGTVTPTTSASPTYGFTVSPGPASGDLEIIALIPNNVAGAGSETFSVNGTTESLVSGTAFTSGFLAAYLGISASPANPIGGLLPTTQTFDSGATGYFVYLADLGTQTLPGPSNPSGTLALNDGTFVFPTGSSIVGFFNEGTAANPDWVATALSGQISIQPTTTAPEPASFALLATGLFGLMGMARRRRLNS